MGSGRLGFTCNGSGQHGKKERLPEPWLEDLGDGSASLYLSVWDERAGDVIGVGGARIRQLQADLYPDVSALQMQSRRSSSRGGQRQLTITGNRRGLLSAIVRLNEVLSEDDAISHSAVRMVSRMIDGSAS